MKKKTVRDIDVKGKRVLVRVDFNVPLKGIRSRTTRESAPLSRPFSICLRRVRL